MKTIAFLQALAMGLMCMSCQPSESEIVAAEPVMTQEELVLHGEYLVNVIGCHDCHTPKMMGPQGPQPDPDRLLMGHPAEDALAPYDPSTTKGWVLFNMHNTAVVGPWGTSFAANLTSDDTGIGTWTEAQFFKAIREGKYKGLDGSRPLLPPMPWPSYARMPDEDLRAIFSYLKTVKPIRNIVPAPIPPAAG